MNYKLLFPTFRNRFLFIKEALEKYGETAFAYGLNLGTGEGDYDQLIAHYCEELLACDINERDVEFARRLNQSVPNITYKVDNALNLNFDAETFDLVISVEVLEHVGRPAEMVREVSRVLKSGGIAMITFPRHNFPLIYDPVNKLFRRKGKKVFSQGAYAFGHDYLIKADEFESWCMSNELQVVEHHNLSGGFIGLLEMYWTGIMQSLLKDNSDNINRKDAKKLVVRPSNKAPWLTLVTDAIIRLDRALFQHAGSSVGKGYILRKK